MSGSDAPFLNRRSLARNTLVAGTFALGSGAQFNATDPELVNVCHVGAKGDGLTDDTAALQRAIDTAAEKRTAVSCLQATILPVSSTCSQPPRSLAFRHGTTAVLEVPFCILRLPTPTVS